MITEQAKEFAETLEELRVELLGADAEIKLLRGGAGGLEVIKTITRCFYLKRRGSVVLGAEFIEVKIAERTPDDQSNFSLAESKETVAAEYQGERYKAGVIDEALNVFRVFVLRLAEKVE